MAIMTEQEYRALPPEAKAALVAEHVMGLEVVENVEGYWYCPTCKEWVHGRQVTFTEHHDRCGGPVCSSWPCDSEGNINPHYTEDIAAAWQVVDQLWNATPRWTFAIELFEDNGQYAAYFKDTQTRDRVVGTSSVHADAICLATLKAKGVVEG